MSQPVRYTIEVNFDRTYPLDASDLERDRDGVRNRIRQTVRTVLAELYSEGAISKPDRVYIEREILGEEQDDRRELVTALDDGF